MKFDSSTLTQETPLNALESESIYNGLDCCVTFEVFECLDELLQKRNDPSFRQVYDFERGLQAPALDLMLRGWRIDEYDRQAAIKSYTLKKARLEHILNTYAAAIWGKPLNARSPDQLKAFFYGAMGIPEVVLSFQGVRRVSTNREALEKVSNYFAALPVVKCIFAIRDVSKLLSVLSTQIDSDKRMRTSYNIAGTETGRWYSTRSVEGTGTNLQNITTELRKIFVADEGWKLAHIDLEQAESRVLGLLLEVLFNDRSYTEAHESGDLHTANAKLLWPGLVRDRESAEQHFYFQYTYRDMSKRGGHATNYVIKPWTMSRHLHIPIALAEEFQQAYHSAYPSIRKYHNWCAKQIQLHSTLTTPLGRQREFYGRTGNDEIIREAVAFIPQSTVADCLNIILWRIWKYMPEVQLLGQTHDSIDFQYREENEVEVLTKFKDLGKVPITYEGKSLTIPVDIATGWNWAPIDRPPFHPKMNPNPNGLMKWKGKPDGRVRIGGLDRLVS